MLPMSIRKRPYRYFIKKTKNYYMIVFSMLSSHDFIVKHPTTIILDYTTLTEKES